MVRARPLSAPRTAGEGAMVLMAIVVAVKGSAIAPPAKVKTIHSG